MREGWALLSPSCVFYTYLPPLASLLGGVFLVHSLNPEPKPKPVSSLPCGAPCPIYDSWPIPHMTHGPYRT